ncbi:MAG: 5'/3'-nucleotidase SurE [Acidobacteria bacterium]|nr:5'/3'-nucleotidase SurE [Acidobacteriota bacterium]
MHEILITNDDGIQSPALEALENALSGLGNVTVVAPDREMSATSHCVTLNQPLRYYPMAPNRFAVQGTPADCVILASLRILKEPPALVIAGVNRGANVGDDIAYSGTVAAAFEAALRGIPGIAVSTYARENADYVSPAQVAARIAAQVLDDGLPPDVILNVNYPKDWNGEFRLTRQGRRVGKTVLVENLDPRGREYFWLDEELHNEQESARPTGPPTDYEALAAGYVSICPLQINRTAHIHLDRFARWAERLDNNATEPAR